MLDANSKSSAVRSNSRMKGQRGVTANDSSPRLDSHYNTGQVMQSAIGSRFKNAQMLRPHTSHGGKRRNLKDKAAEAGTMAQRQRLKSSLIKRKGEVAVLRNTDASRARVASALDKNTQHLSVPETAVSSRARTRSAEMIEPLTE